MHSKIYQISKAPISKEDYTDPEYYYDNSSDFADYIGDEIEGQEREDCISYLADVIKDVFTPCGKDTFVYKGEEAMHKFKQDLCDFVKKTANELTPDNILSNNRLFKLQQIADETHLESSKRVHIMDWDGCAGPIMNLFEFASSQLKEGDKIYIGAVIDYHF